MYNIYRANKKKAPRSIYPQSLLFFSPLSATLLQRNALVFAVAKRQVHVLQTLCSSALEQIINSSIDNDALAGAVDSEPANLHAVLARDVAHERGLANDLDELLAGVAVLVDVADITGGHGAVEGDGDCVLVNVRLVISQLVCKRNLREYPGTT